MSKILFVSVHPDDETLGCGGTILKHKENGDIIEWLIITAPTLNHPFGFSENRIMQRDRQIAEVTKRYDFSQVYDLRFPTQLLDEINFRDLVVSIDEIVNKCKPEVLYLINRSDVHSDHRIAFKAAYSCTKNFRKPFVKRILMYETLSETEFAPALQENAFIPNFFVDISSFIEKKIDIMKLYGGELMPDPYPRSIHAIKGLAAYRGSRIGVLYAEAFMLLLETN